jgi:hypothetical protein
MTGEMLAMIAPEVKPGGCQATVRTVKVWQWGAAVEKPGVEVLSRPLFIRFRQRGAAGAKERDTACH